MEHGEPDDGADDDLVGYRSPLPPDDRIWRHPSELTWADSPPPPRPRRTFPIALVSGLCGSVLTVGLLAATGVLTDERPVREVVVREAVAPAASTAGRGIADVVEAAADSVVRVEVSGAEPGVGSGVVFRDDGRVLTNAHVVEGADGVVVVLRDGRELQATVVGADPETDLAVLAVDAGEPLDVAVLGSVDDLVVGDTAIAIGSPLGLDGAASVTSGIVSALGRAVESQGGLPLIDMIQTDAAIAPGSSGGALLDGRGAVIGITTAFAVTDGGAEGLGFATTIDVARAVAADLLEHGRVRPPWLGVRGDDAPGGALVDEVMDGSPAEDGGLHDGDVVVGIDGVEVRSMSALRIALRRHRPGDAVELAVLRGDERISLRVSLGERPDR